MSKEIVANQSIPACRFYRNCNCLVFPLIDLQSKTLTDLLLLLLLLFFISLRHEMKEGRTDGRTDEQRKEKRFFLSLSLISLSLTFDRQRGNNRVNCRSALPPCQRSFKLTSVLSLSDFFLCFSVLVPISVTFVVDGALFPLCWTCKYERIVGERFGMH